MFKEKLMQRYTLSDIVQGYEKICELSEKIKSLLFTFESNHLKKFHLTWVLLNRRMYQKYVFASFSETAIQCMLKVENVLAFLKLQF